jgi:alkanesulfonate monooxygenase SsuD/methylene tetrahydromethanopterin reductase-like flavin-dependent oxidoreductase (luciferase family)
MKAFFPSTHVPTNQLVPLAARAEELGWDGCGLGHHILCPESVAERFAPDKQGTEQGLSAFVGRKDPGADYPEGTPYWPDSEFPEIWAAIAAMAAVTTRLEFLPTVYLITLVHPLVVAHGAATAAAVAGGNRVMLGLGSGWLVEEFAPLSQPIRRRGARMAEEVEILRKAWSGDFVEHRGEFYEFDKMRLHQQPPEMPPIMIGAGSERGLTRVAEIGDGFVAGRATLERFLENRAFVERKRKELGTDERPFLYANIIRRAESENVDLLKRWTESGCDIARIPVFELYGCGWGNDARLEQRLEALEWYAEKYLDVIHGT